MLFFFDYFLKIIMRTCSSSRDTAIYLLESILRGQPEKGPLIDRDSLIDTDDWLTHSGMSSS